MSQLSKYRYSTTTALIVIAIVEILFWSIGYATYYYVTEEVPEFRFENQWALYLFIMIPFMLILFFRIISWKNKAIKRTQTIFKKSQCKYSVTIFIAHKIH